MAVVWKIRSDGVRQRFNISPLRKEVVKLYKEGLSSRKVGERLRISHARVLRILRSENETRRSIIHKIPNENYDELTPSRAYIFGVMCGDGCVFSGTEKKGKWEYKSHIVHLSVKDKDFLDEYVKRFGEVYGFFPKLYYRNRKNSKWSNIWIARINKKLVYEDLARNNFSKMWHVPNEIMDSDSKMVISSFLRGIYDSEGSVTIGKRGATISFYSVSKEGIKQVKELLEKIGIKSSEIAIDNREFRKNICYYFHITGLNNYLIFLENIGFSIERKKRKLLDYISKLKTNKVLPLNLKTKSS